MHTEAFVGRQGRGTTGGSRRFHLWGKGLTPALYQVVLTYDLLTKTPCPSVNHYLGTYDSEWDAASVYGK